MQLIALFFFILGFVPVLNHEKTTTNSSVIPHKSSTAEKASAASPQTSQPLSHEDQTSVVSAKHDAPVVSPAATAQEPEQQTDFGYAAAFEKAQASDRPLVVIVTATWCAPCQVMKDQTIKQVMAKDGFHDVILALVDVDEEPELAKNLTKGKGIPHVVVFEKNEEKWKRRTLFGFQTVETLSAFIKPKYAEALSNSAEAIEAPTERIADKDQVKSIR